MADEIKRPLTPEPIEPPFEQATVSYQAPRRKRFYVLFRTGINDEADLYKGSDGNYYRRYERKKVFKRKSGEYKFVDTVQYQKVNFKYDPAKPKPKDKNIIEDALIKLYQTLKTLNLSYDEINNLKKMALGLYREREERKQANALAQYGQLLSTGGTADNGGGDRDYSTSPTDHGENSEDERREAYEIDSPTDSQEDS